MNEYQGEITDASSESKTLSMAVLLFQPKYRLAHPESHLLSLSKKTFSWSKYPKVLMFNFEITSTGPWIVREERNARGVSSRVVVLRAWAAIVRGREWWGCRPIKVSEFYQVAEPSNQLCILLHDACLQLCHRMCALPCGLQRRFSQNINNFIFGYFEPTIFFLDNKNK